MDFDYTEEPWRTQAYHLIRELVGVSVMSFESEDRESRAELIQMVARPITDLGDERDRSRLLAHTVYEAVGLIDEILLEAASAQARLAADEGGAVLTDPLSLVPAVLERRREMWQKLMEREQLD